MTTELKNIKITSFKGLGTEGRNCTCVGSVLEHKTNLCLCNPIYKEISEPQLQLRVISVMSGYKTELTEKNI